MNESCFVTIVLISVLGGRAKMPESVVTAQPLTIDRTITITTSDGCELFLSEIGQQ